MTHPSDLTLSTHADSALPAADEAAIVEHISSCEQCTAKLAELRSESRLIAMAFEAEAKNLGEAVGSGAERAIPAFKRPAGLREFAMFNLTTALLIWMVSFLWKTLFGELVVSAAQVAVSAYSPTAYELISSSITYYVEKGTAMFSAYIAYVCLAVVVSVLVWWLSRSGKHQGLAGLFVIALVGGAGLGSQPASALEVRYDKNLLRVDATETIDDTLLAAAETVLIKGDVTGDLMVAGQRVEVDGNIGGNLIAFAETVTVRGVIGGTVISAAARVELREASTGGDLWAAAEIVVLDEPSKVGGNATVAGDQALVGAAVGKDLTALGETIEVGGRLGGDLSAYAGEIRLLATSAVEGDARLRLESEDQLQRESGSRIDGELEFLPLPEELEPESRYSRVEFYLWQLARLVSAVLVGLAVLWLFPALGVLSVSAGVDGLKTAGVGLIALIVMPILALIVAFSVIGLPFSLITIGLWLVILYLAKIVVGVFLGRTLLANTEQADNLFLVVLAGIALIVLVVNLPWIGGLVSLVITIVGAGLLVQHLLGVVAAGERY